MASPWLAGIGGGLQSIGMMLAQNYQNEQERKREEERYRLERERQQSWRDQDVARADRLRSEDIARSDTQRQEGQFASVLAGQRGNTSVSPEIAAFADKNPYIKSMINPALSGVGGLPPAPLRPLEADPQQGLIGRPNEPLKRRGILDEELDAQAQTRGLQNRASELQIQTGQSALDEQNRLRGIRNNIPAGTPFSSLLNKNAPIDQVQAFDLENIIAQMMEGEKNRGFQAAQANRVPPMTLATLPTTLFNAAYAKIEEQVSKQFDPLIKAATDLGDVATAQQIMQQRSAMMNAAKERAQRQANEQMGPILQMLPALGVQLPKNASQIMNFPKGMLPEEAQAQYIQQQLAPVQQKFASLPPAIAAQRKQEFDAAVANIETSPDPALAIQAISAYVNALGQGGVGAQTASPNIQQPSKGGMLEGQYDPITNLLQNLLGSGNPNTPPPQIPEWLKNFLKPGGLAGTGPVR